MFLRSDLSLHFCGAGGGPECGERAGCGREGVPEAGGADLCEHERHPPVRQGRHQARLLLLTRQLPGQAYRYSCLARPLLSEAVPYLSIFNSTGIPCH
jgi:hypothetical protein